ncbi:MAG: T9SS C-terminal target domain-containing protein [Saprospirales bacterium]|nr:MAG: T9SS C-terminal target domain-containing protein [Saprospirales bacterium]
MKSTQLKTYFTFFILIKILLFLPDVANAQANIELREFATGFLNPLGIEHAGDDRIFVIEKRGTIRSVDSAGNYSGFFLDIRNRVRSLGGEQGLLGLAFHPDFEQNGFFFVNYTNLSGTTVVSRFSVDENNPALGDENSEIILMEFSQPFANHNGGQLLFGPDGYLYIFSGDGGSGGDPINAGQDPLTFLGKILRIDVDNGDPYAIPEDNPFFGSDFELDEIWALGLRNPWRNSFDRLTGDLWIADVGQSAREEINFQSYSSPGGENYGWRCYEGFLPFNLSGDCDPDDFVFPIYEYVTHGQNGCSITGGYVYRGQAIPDLYGTYVFGDFCTGLIFSLEWDSISMEYRSEIMFNIFGGQLASFGEDVHGELYVTHYGQGRISKLVNPCIDITLDYEWTLPDCWDSDNGILSLELNHAEEPIQVIWADGDDSGLSRELACGLIDFVIFDNRNCELEFSLDLECREELFPEILESGDSLFSSIDGVFYRWYLNEELQKESEESFLVPDQSGTYRLEVWDENDCIYTSDAFDFIISSIPEFSATDSDLLLYPNPVRNILYIEAPLPIEKADIRIFSSNGKLFAEFTVKNSGKIIPLSFENIPMGWYLIEITMDEKESSVFRVYKEN